ncbi:hypothetical protein STEG23_029202 [Scotinomys teguina]
MYHSNGQKQHGTFVDKEQLVCLQADDASCKFKCEGVANGKVLPNDSVFLQPYGEMTLCKYYEKRLLAFCLVFKPNSNATRSVVVDEFNISGPKFVRNLRESPHGQEKALKKILEDELLLIQQFNFHLIVHNPYRPFEGFVIDIRTRYPYWGIQRF